MAEGAISLSDAPQNRDELREAYHEWIGVHKNGVELTTTDLLILAFGHEVFDVPADGTVVVPTATVRALCDG